MKKISKVIIILMLVFLPFSMLGCSNTSQNSDMPNKYTISVVANLNSSVTGSGLYEEGSVITIGATANDGYCFDSWNDGNTTACREIVVTGNKTYVASFKSVEIPEYTCISFTYFYSSN